MSHSNDDKGGKPKPQDPSPDTGESGKRSGRATFDSRGNSVWEWQLETGVYSRDVTTQKLRKLDLGELSIAESGIHQQPPGPEQGNAATPRPTAAPPSQSRGKPVPAPGGSGNPYDSRASTTNRNPGGGINPYDSGVRPPPGAGTNPYDTAGASGKRFNPHAKPERRRTPADLRALDQQIKEQRKKLKE